MSRIILYALLLLMPLTLSVGEIQHVFGGAAEALSIAVIILVLFCVVLPIVYYQLRIKFLAYLLFIVGGLFLLTGLLIGLSGSGAAVFLGVLFLLAGTLLIRLPIKRKPM